MLKFNRLLSAGVLTILVACARHEVSAQSTTRAEFEFRGIRFTDTLTAADAKKCMRDPDGTVTCMIVPERDSPVVFAGFRSYWRGKLMSVELTLPSASHGLMLRALTLQFGEPAGAIATRAQTVAGGRVDGSASYWLLEPDTLWLREVGTLRSDMSELSIHNPTLRRESLTARDSLLKKMIKP